MNEGDNVLDLFCRSLKSPSVILSEYQDAFKYNRKRHDHFLSFKEESLILQWLIYVGASVHRLI